MSTRTRSKDSSAPLVPARGASRPRSSSDGVELGLRDGGADPEGGRPDGLERPAGRAGQGAPADLAALCMALLARDPADRYRTAEDMADEIGRAHV